MMRPDWVRSLALIKRGEREISVWVVNFIFCFFRNFPGKKVVVKKENFSCKVYKKKLYVS